MIAFIGGDALLNYMQGQFHHRMDVDRLVGGTSAGGDPNALATTLASSIPLFMALAFYFRHTVMRAFFLFTGLGMIPLIALTGSRAGVLALATVAIGGAALSRQKVLILFLAILVMTVGFFALPEQYQARYMRFAEVAENLDEASSGRWTIWFTGAKMAVERPVFGIGAGAFVWAYASGDYGSPQYLEPHNLFIQIAATTGFIGLAVWLTFLWFLISQMLDLRRSIISQTKSSWAGPFINGFLVAIASLLVSGMFGHNLYRYTWYVVAALIVVLFQIAKSQIISETDVPNQVEDEQGSNPALSKGELPA
jgi:O-antigen ligase